MLTYNQPLGRRPVCLPRSNWPLTYMARTSASGQALSSGPKWCFLESKCGFTEALLLSRAASAGWKTALLHLASPAGGRLAFITRNLQIRGSLQAEQLL